MNGPEHYRRAEELLEGRRNGTAAQIDAATGLTERWDKTLNA